MGLRKAIWPACGVLAVGWTAMAQETVKLEYKLKPGTELSYKLSGTAKMFLGGQGEMQSTLSGAERFVIADADAATGVMLIGQLQASKMTTKINMMAANMNLQKGEQTQEMTLDGVSACRLDRVGNVIARTMKDVGKFQPNVRRMLRNFDCREIPGVELPAGTVAVSASWESATGSPFLGFPGVPVSVTKVVSVLAEVKTIDGRKCAVIKSKLSPSDKTPVTGESEFAVSGDVETLFDIEGGFSRSVSGKFTLKANLGGTSVTGTQEATMTLDSTKTLPPADVAREAKVIRTFDGAVASLYAGEYLKAADALESLKPEELPGSWKSGINEAMGSVKIIAQLAQGGPITPPNNRP